MIVGSFYRDQGKCFFSVWAPFADKVFLRLVAPEERMMAMEKNSAGYWEVEVNQ